VGGGANPSINRRSQGVLGSTQKELTKEQTERKTNEPRFGQTGMGEERGKGKGANKKTIEGARRGEINDTHVSK